MSKLGLFSIGAIQAGRPPQGIADTLHDADSRAVLGDWYEERGVAARGDLETLDRLSYIGLRLADIGRSRDVARERRSLEDERSALQKQLRGELAGERGWSPARSHFGFDELVTGRRPPYSSEIDSGGLLDHEERFRELVRPFRPAAILTHSYNARPGDFEQLAVAAGLAVEIFPFSWYSGSCTAALFTRPPTWKPAPSRQELTRARWREVARELRELRRDMRALRPPAAPSSSSLMPRR